MLLLLLLLLLRCCASTDGCLPFTARPRLQHSLIAVAVEVLLLHFAPLLRNLDDHVCEDVLLQKAHRFHAFLTATVSLINCPLSANDKFQVKPKA